MAKLKDLERDELFNVIADAARRRDHVLVMETAAELLKRVDPDAAEAAMIPRSHAVAFLNGLAQQSRCRECDRPIWFIKNPRSGRSMPITADLINHFVDCPKAESFRKGGSRR